ncbi:MAG: hypothetical protein NT023_04560 [Armatimonadetes bacterium]|nr:hypothetical protein [Armatimonadota bacterium]
MKNRLTSTALLSALFVVAGIFGWAGALSRWKLVHQAQRRQGECMEHLREIGKALNRYQAEHNGKLPEGPLTLLVPKYLPDNSVFICSTVQERGDLASVFMAKGGLPFHYTHLYLGRDFPAAVQLKQGKAPVLGCTFHTWEGARGIQNLILRKDGEVDAVDASHGPDLLLY